MRYPARADAVNSVVECLETRVLFDSAPPTMYVGSSPDAEGRGKEYVDVRVVYVDDGVGDTGVDLATLGDGDIVITGPNGYSAPGTYIPPSRPPFANRSIGAHYRVPAPGGTLDETDNGVYVVNAVPGEVTDAAGNAATRDPVRARGTGLGVITVNVPPQDGPDLYVSAAEPLTPVTVYEGKERKARPPLRVTLTNVGNAPSRGVVRLTVMASNLGLDVVGELSRRQVDLDPGESQTFRLKNKPWPRYDRESWALSAGVEADVSVDRWKGNNGRTFGRYVVIPRPRVDLELGPPTLTAAGGVLRGGRKVQLTFSVTNVGLAPANGRLVAAIDLVRDPADADSGGIDIPVTVRARPGATGVGRGTFTLPSKIAGDFYVVIQYLTKYPWPASGTDDDKSISATPVRIEPGAA